MCVRKQGRSYSSKSLTLLKLDINVEFGKWMIMAKMVGQNILFYLPTEIHFLIGERVMCHRSNLTNSLGKSNNLNIRLTRDRVVHLKIRANLCTCWHQVNSFLPVSFIFWVERYNNTLTGPTTSSETQGLLAGTMRYFWSKVCFKTWRTPGNLFLPNQFQKWSNSVPLIGQKNLFLPNQQWGLTG